MIEQREQCPFVDGWENQEGWFEFNGKLICADWDEQCVLCRTGDSKDFEITVDESVMK